MIERSLQARLSRRGLLRLGALGFLALGGQAILSACGAKGEEGVKIEPLTPTAETSSTRVVEALKPVPPEEAKSILNAEFKPTTFETVKRSINLAYERHPDAVNFKFLQTGERLPKEDIDLFLNQCRYNKSRAAPCGYLVRDLYGHYMQSGYEEFYQSAVDVYNYFLTELQDQPGQKESILYVLKIAFEESNLPLK